jgi:hypothetical protein
MFFLRQFCHALDHCLFVLSGKRFFPFVSKLYTLFFERVHATQPTVPHFPTRPMFDAHVRVVDAQEGIV